MYSGRTHAHTHARTFHEFARVISTSVATHTHTRKLRERRSRNSSSRLSVPLRVTSYLTPAHCVHIDATRFDLSPRSNQFSDLRTRTRRENAWRFVGAFVGRSRRDLPYFNETRTTGRTSSSASNPRAKDRFAVLLISFTPAGISVHAAASPQPSHPRILEMRARASVIFLVSMPRTLPGRSLFLPLLFLLLLLRRRNFPRHSHSSLFSSLRKEEEDGGANFAASFCGAGEWMNLLSKGGGTALRDAMCCEAIIAALLIIVFFQETSAS